MNILYLRTHYYLNVKVGGSVSHTAGVINSLSKKHNVVVYSNEILPHINNVQLHVIKPVLIKHLPNHINELIYNIKIIKKLKNIDKFDAIYHRYSGFSFAPSYLAKKNNITLILEYNGSEVWMTKHWTHWTQPVLYYPKILCDLYYNHIRIPIISIIENYNLKSANLIVVVSKAMANELLNRGISLDKILINPNGVDITKFNPYVKFDDILEKFNLHNRTILGFIGSFSIWHGVENIVLAYNKLISESEYYKNITKLLLIGDGPLMPNVKELISKLQIQNNVITTGIIPHDLTPKYLNACDILINATVPNPDGSEFFGSPTKLFEYMAMGKAIISSNIGQMAEILENYQDAILVKAGDIDELKYAMKILINDHELRKKLGMNAREKVTKNYSWDIHVDRIINKLYEIKFQNKTLK